jgi:hypothetical protein
LKKTRFLAAAALAGAAVLVTAAPGDAAGLQCREQYSGSFPNGTTFSGNVRPSGPDRAALGEGQLAVPDGPKFILRPDLLSCRRDGGLVPPRGGANNADTRGSAMLVGGGTPFRGTFNMHVEDRGPQAERGLDFVALQVLDAAGTEVYFDANFLASGEVDLIPTDAPAK